MEQTRHAIVHYTDDELPNAGSQLNFQVQLKETASPGKGFFYWLVNLSDRAGTAVVQKSDVINNKRTWELVTLAPNGTRDLGYDRPDGPVFRQWYFWTTTTGRQGNHPWYPIPVIDSAYGSLAVMEQGNNWFLINRDTFQKCRVSWESNLVPSPQEETIDEGGVALGDIGISRPHRLEVIFSNLMPPTNLANDIDETEPLTTPHEQSTCKGDLPAQRD